MVNFCSHCGARLEADSSFCGSCGARIGPAMAEASGVPPIAVAAAPRARGLSPKLVWSVLGLLSILGVSYVAASPYIALQGYQSAVERRAFSELADAFDREELKRSLAGAINGALDKLRADDAEVGIRPNNELSMLAGLVTQGLGAGLDKALSRESLIELESMVKTGAGIADVMVPPQKKEEALKLYAHVTDGVAVSTGYVSLNTFGVEAKKPALGSVRLLFKRHGLVGWRLASIETNDALVYAMRKMGIGTSEKSLADASIERKNLPLAAKWLKSAAEDGSAVANLQIAVIYLEGIAGYKRNVETAINYSKVAFEGGDYRGAALIGAIYEAGVDMPSNISQAVSWYEKALVLEPKDWELVEHARALRFMSTKFGEEFKVVDEKWLSTIAAASPVSRQGIGSITIGASARKIKGILGEPGKIIRKASGLELQYAHLSSQHSVLRLGFRKLLPNDTDDEHTLDEGEFMNFVTSTGTLRQPPLPSNLVAMSKNDGDWDCPMNLGDPLTKLVLLSHNKVGILPVIRSRSDQYLLPGGGIPIGICSKTGAIVRLEFR